MKQILIGEDNPLNLELLREVLEALGYEVLEAGDGQQLLDRLDQTQPDLVLLDIQFPALDGYAILQRIRGSPRFTRLPVIAVTAYAMPGDRDKALRAGFDGYITKPIDIPALTAAVKNALADTNPGRGGSST